MAALDAFMDKVSETVQRERTIAITAPYAPPAEIVSGGDHDYEFEFDDTGAAKSADTDIGYDSDGNPVKLKDKKSIEPLPPIDHSKINYQAVTKNFYR